MTRNQWEQARLAGENARRAGRGREKCPLYGMGDDGRALQEAWLSGWESADDERKAA